MSQGTGSESDLKAFKKMKEEMQVNFDEKMRLLNQTYQEAVNDLQDQHKQHQEQVELMYQDALMKHNQMLQESNQAFKKAELETQKVGNEREKILLETKKLTKLAATQNEPKVESARGEHRISNQFVQQRVQGGRVAATTPKSGATKKKAADFYFQKGKAEDTSKPTVTKKKSDFMSRDVSPKPRKSIERKSVNPKPNPAFTYDKPTVSPVTRQSTQNDQYAQPNGSNSPTSKIQPSKPNGRRSRPDTNAWKNGMGSGTSPDKGDSALDPHRTYVSPALGTKSALKNDLYQNQGASALRQPSAPYQAAVQTKPDFPQKLIDEFKAEPENFPGQIPALHNGEAFTFCFEKWQKLGVLYADDIVRNAPDHCPVDYNLRVSENDTQSGMGQVDRNGRLQGIGRECQDFIYEGQFKDNLYHGWGRYISAQGVYWGLFNMGLRHGKGKWIGADGGQAEGNWVNGQLK